ncbi:MAG TPA: acyl-CoA dehydrogenase family protein [Candidatus Dormibacteraeota bacterium]|jgi:glutaryl-CoA dehydrogenase|nr:acyl-CoA dehydrogenase family protein [Candidatus Dormibacteraeota bacterium]
MATSSATPRTRSQRQLAKTDLYEVDELLSDDERLVRDTVHTLVVDRLLPVVAAHFEAGTFPAELIPEVAGVGLLGMHLHGYDCAGASAVAYGVACEELEAGDSGLRSFVSVQGSLAMFPIHAYGSEEQKQRWLPAMAAGRVIGCFGLTEPDAGSDPAAMRTTARRDGDDWVLNGTKMWISNGSIADIAVVWARTDDDIRGFVVERGTRGFAAHDITGKLSLRASVTSELSFDDVRLPGDAVLPGVAGMRGPLSCLNEARYGIAWGAMGAARSCFEAALDYSKQRVAFGRPIAARQLIQQKLADMATSLVQGRLVAHRLGVLKDAGRATPVQVSLAKRANVRAALDIARTARTILGANGITLEYPVARHMANLESVLTYEGTEEVHTLILGKALTGEDAFS